MATSSLALHTPKSFAWTHGQPAFQSLVGVVAANFNMLPWSLFAQATDFTNSFFTYSNSSIQTGFLGPTGLNNASFLKENNANSTHNVVASAGNTSGIGLNTATTIHYRIAVLAKAASRTRMVVNWQTQINVDNNATVSIGFDLTGGNTGYDNVVGSTSSLVAQSMVNKGSGWWLCTFDIQYNGSASGLWQPQIFLDNGSGTAARSITYAGDGSSGIELLWFSVLPVSAYALSKLAFSDDFANVSQTIDLNNTKAPGFNWYLNNNFPNCPLTTFLFRAEPSSIGASFTQFSPSVLKIFNPNINQNKWTSFMMTGVDNGSGGFMGQTFSPPMIWDSYVSWDGLFADQSPNWNLSPAFWTMPKELLINTLSPTNFFMEWDVFEGIDFHSDNTSGSETEHEWTWVDPANPVVTVTRSVNSIFGSVNAAMTTGNFRRVSGMWLTIASTGGTYGVFMNFVDGQYSTFSDNSYTVSAPFQSVQWEGNNYPIFVDTSNNVTGLAGGGFPFYVDWIKVYTA